MYHLDTGVVGIDTPIGQVDKRFFDRRTRTLDQCVQLRQLRRQRMSAASFEAQRLAFLDKGLSQADPAALGRFEGRRVASIARGCRKSIMASSRDRKKTCVSVIELTPENAQKRQHYCALLAGFTSSIFR